MPALTQPGADSRTTANTTRDNQLEDQDRQRQTIEKLAYALWKDRGCPEGTAETDWLEAEQKLTERALQASGR
jgi:hypothetical protein